MNGILVTDGIPTERNFRWIIIILFVIHPMYVEILKRAARTVSTPISYKLAISRMQRFNTFIERLYFSGRYLPGFWAFRSLSYGSISIVGIGCLEIWPS